jgi:gliding motility-associated-like protein
MKNKTMNYLLFIILTLISYSHIVGQDILISNGGTVLVNGGELFYDAGGAIGNDGNTNHTITLKPAKIGEAVCIDFSSFNSYYNGTISSSDRLTIYDGLSTSSNNIGVLSGNYGLKYNNSSLPYPVGIPTINSQSAVLSPTIFCSTNNDGALTIVFTNFSSETSPGFVGKIKTYQINQTPGCSIITSADKSSICIGESVTLSVEAKIISPSIDNNFNNSTLGNGWESTPSANFVSNVCATPSIDNTVYLWMQNQACPRTLSTNSINTNNGGVISFEYRQATYNGIGETPSGSSPCEAPDLQASKPEGIYLQYTIDGGLTWNTFKYIFPHSNPDSYNGCGNYVKGWSKMTYPIPVEAKSSATKFRWIQEICTSESTDNWGLDNILITVPNPTTITWKNVTKNQDINSSQNSPFKITETPKETTTYRATISDGTSSCEQEITIKVSDFLTEVTGNTDCVNPTGSIQVTASGTGPFKYSKDNGVTFGSSFTFNNLNHGSYIIVVKDEGSSNCLLKRTVEVPNNTNGPLPPAVTSPINYCQQGVSSSLSATGVNLKWYDSESGTNSIQTPTPSTSAIGKTTYYVSQTVNGCESTRSIIEVIVSANPSKADFSLNGSPFCPESTLTTSATITGTQGGTFSGTAGLTLNQLGEINLSSSTSGVHRITYTIAENGNCPSVSTFTDMVILPVQTPISSFAYNSPICDTSKNPLPFSGAGFTTGGIYEGISAQALNSISGEIDLSKMITGKYTIKYTVKLPGCSKTMNSTFELEINPSTEPNTNFSFTSPVCMNKSNPVPSLDAQFNTGGNYSSSTGLFINNVTGEIDLSKSPKGEHSVTYTKNATSCGPIGKKTIQIELSTPASASINYDNQPLCPTGIKDVTITGTTGGIFSSTSGLEINPTTGQLNLAISTPGDYLVTYSILPIKNCDAFSTSTSVKINQPTTPIVQFNYKNAYCTSELNPIPSKSSGFSTIGKFSGTNSLPINSATGEINLATASSGNYLITYKVLDDNCNPTASFSQNISIDIPNTATISYPAFLCPNNLTQTVSISGNNSGLFSGNSGLVISTNTGEINLAASTPGNYTINYEIPSSGSCPSKNISTTTTINSIDAPVTIFTYNSIYCKNNQNPVPKKVAGFTSGGVFKSTGNLNVNPASGEINLANSIGNFEITYIAETNGCGKKDSSKFAIEIKDLPTITTLSDSSICENSSIQLTSSSVIGNTYTWSGPLNFTSTLQSPVINSSKPTMSGTYTVIVTDAFSCKNNALFLLKVAPLDVLTIKNQADLCTNDSSVYLMAIPIGGQWSGNGITDATLGKFSPTKVQEGDVNVKYTSSGKCPGAKSINIRVNKTPIIDFLVSDTSGCAPYSLKFFNNSTDLNSTYNWDFGDGTFGDSIQHVHTYKDFGNYSVKLTTTQNGCTNEKKKDNYIHVDQSPKADFSVDTSKLSQLFTTLQFYNNSKGNNIIWNFGDSKTSTEKNPTHTYPQEPNNYSVKLTVFSTPKCSDSKTISFSITEDPFFYVPNSFTPNGDEINNVFLPIANGGIDPQFFAFFIYNRWGELLFESHNKDYGWDGSYGNKLCESGVYIWKVEYKEKSLKKKQMSGHLNLIN